MSDNAVPVYSVALFPQRGQGKGKADNAAVNNPPVVDAAKSAKPVPTGRVERSIPGPKPPRAHSATSSSSVHNQGYTSKGTGATVRAGNVHHDPHPRLAPVAQVSLTQHQSLPTSARQSSTTSPPYPRHASTGHGDIRKSKSATQGVPGHARVVAVQDPIPHPTDSPAAVVNTRSVVDWDEGELLDEGRPALAGPGVTGLSETSREKFVEKLEHDLCTIDRALQQRQSGAPVPVHHVPSQSHVPVASAVTSSSSPQIHHPDHGLQERLIGTGAGASTSGQSARQVRASISEPQVSHVRREQPPLNDLGSRLGSTHATLPQAHSTDSKVYPVSVVTSSSTQGSTPVTSLATQIGSKVNPPARKRGIRGTAGAAPGGRKGGKSNEARSGTRGRAPQAPAGAHSPPKLHLRLEDIQNRPVRTHSTPGMRTAGSYISPTRRRQSPRSDDDPRTRVYGGGVQRAPRHSVSPDRRGNVAARLHHTPGGVFSRAPRFAGQQGPSPSPSSQSFSTGASTSAVPNDRMMNTAPRTPPRATAQHRHLDQSPRGSPERVSQLIAQAEKAISSKEHRQTTTNPGAQHDHQQQQQHHSPRSDGKRVAWSEGAGYTRHGKGSPQTENVLSAPSGQHEKHVEAASAPTRGGHNAVPIASSAINMVESEDESSWVRLDASEREALMSPVLSSTPGMGAGVTHSTPPSLHRISQRPGDEYIPQSVAEYPPSGSRTKQAIKKRRVAGYVRKGPSDSPPPLSLLPHPTPGTPGSAKPTKSPTWSEGGQSSGGRTTTPRLLVPVLLPMSDGISPAQALHDVYPDPTTPVPGADWERRDKGISRRDWYTPSPQELAEMEARRELMERSRARQEELSMKREAALQNSRYEDDNDDDNGDGDGDVHPARDNPEISRLLEQLQSDRERLVSLHEKVQSELSESIALSTPKSDLSGTMSARSDHRQDMPDERHDAQHSREYSETGHHGSHVSDDHGSVVLRSYSHSIDEGHQDEQHRLKDTPGTPSPSANRSVHRRTRSGTLGSGRAPSEMNDTHTSMPATPAPALPNPATTRVVRDSEFDVDSSDISTGILLDSPRSTPRRGGGHDDDHDDEGLTTPRQEGSTFVSPSLSAATSPNRSRAAHTSPHTSPDRRTAKPHPMSPGQTLSESTPPPPAKVHVVVTASTPEEKDAPASATPGAAAAAASSGTAVESKKATRSKDKPKGEKAARASSKGKGKEGEKAARASSKGKGKEGEKAVRASSKGKGKEGDKAVRASSKGKGKQAKQEDGPSKGRVPSKSRDRSNSKKKGEEPGAMKTADKTAVPAAQPAAAHTASPGDLEAGRGAGAITVAPIASQVTTGGDGDDDISDIGSNVSDYRRRKCNGQVIIALVVSNILLLALAIVGILWGAGVFG